MDAKHGKIIGGSINAEIQVVAGVIGNKSEKKHIYQSRVLIEKLSVQNLSSSGKNTGLFWMKQPKQKNKPNPLN